MLSLRRSRGIISSEIPLLILHKILNNANTSNRCRVFESYSYEEVGQRMKFFDDFVRLFD